MEMASEQSETSLLHCNRDLQFLIELPPNWFKIEQNGVYVYYNQTPGPDETGYPSNLTVRSYDPQQGDHLALARQSVALNNKPQFAAQTDQITIDSQPASLVSCSWYEDRVKLKLWQLQLFVQREEGVLGFIFCSKEELTGTYRPLFRQMVGSLRFKDESYSTGTWIDLITYEMA